jgi:hypothetical protein
VHFTAFKQLAQLNAWPEMNGQGGRIYAHKIGIK